MFVVATSAVSLCSGEVQSAVSDLQRLLSGVADDVSELVEKEAAVVSHLKEQQKKCRANLFEKIRALASDAEPEIDASCAFWNSKRASWYETKKESERLKILTDLLELLPYCFGQGAFRLSEATKVAMDRARKQLEKRRTKLWKKWIFGKHVEIEKKDFEKLRVALRMVRRDFSRLNKANAMYALILMLHYGIPVSAESFEENSARFERAYREVCESFVETEMEEAAAVFEQMWKRTEAIRNHLETGENALKELCSLLSDAESDEEKVEACREAVKTAISHVNHEMSFLKYGLSDEETLFGRFVTKMEFAMLFMRTARLAFSFHVQGGGAD